MTIQFRHIMLMIQDVPAAVKFYQEGLGLTVVNASPNMAELDANGTKIIIHGAENQAEVGGSPILSFHVADLLETIAKLESLGASLQGRVREPSFGKVAAMRSPEGHIISLLQPKKATEQPLTFEEAIAYTETLLARKYLDDAQLQSEITNLVKTSNGARGFFVCFLTGEWELADNPSPAIIQALQAEPNAIAELLVKNLAMSTAMAITHRRNGSPDQADDSDRVAKRTVLLIEKVDLPEVCAIASQMLNSATSNSGEYAAFFEKWGYDDEQKQAIANVLNK
ncbi:VOC family protein [Pseudanabaena sp. UWO310]|uniref:VOC family protein n=1 Tax=Pseudanabaena sp. UWO310 TaxID=2480795 RepID=UPI0021DFF31A|nr:VOC family protein [Pseudanabaena sp. UWO310]